MRKRYEYPHRRPIRHICWRFPCRDCLFHWRHDGPDLSPLVPGEKRKIRMQGCRETEQTNSYCNYCISTYTANTWNCNYNPFLSNFTYFKFLASHCFIECGSYFFSAVLIRIEYSCLRSNHLFKNYVTSKLLKIEWAVMSKLGDIVSILFILPKQFIRLSLYRTRSTSWAKYWPVYFD